MTSHEPRRAIQCSDIPQERDTHFASARFICAGRSLIQLLSGEALEIGRYIIDGTIPERVSDDDPRVWSTLTVWIPRVVSSGPIGNRTCMMSIFPEASPWPSPTPTNPVTVRPSSTFAGGFMLSQSPWPDGSFRHRCAGNPFRHPLPISDRRVVPETSKHLRLSSACRIQPDDEA